MKYTAWLKALACLASGLCLASSAQATDYTINADYTSDSEDVTISDTTITWASQQLSQGDTVTIEEGYTLELNFDCSTWLDTTYIKGSGTLRLTYTGTVITAADNGFIDEAFSATSGSTFAGTLALADGVQLTMTRGRGGKMAGFAQIIVEDGANWTCSGISNDSTNTMPSVKVSIAGTGLDSEGAIVFGSSTYLRSAVTLAANATVSSSATVSDQFQTNTWDCNGYTLTKIGSGTLTFASSSGLNVGSGNLVISAGDIDGTVTFGAGETKTISIAGTQGSTKTVNADWALTSASDVITLQRSATNFGTMTYAGALSGFGTLKPLANTASGYYGTVMFSGDASSFTGTIHPGNVSGRGQLNITGNTSTYSGTTIDLAKESGNYSLLHLPSSLSIAGVTDTDASPVSYITSTSTDNVLTLAGSGTYTYGGTIGSGNYTTANKNTSQGSSTAISIAKTGSGTQTFSGTTALNDVTVSAGTLALSGASTTVSGDVTLSGDGVLSTSTLDLSGKTLDLTDVTSISTSLQVTSLTVDADTVLKLPASFATGDQLASAITVSGEMSAANLYIGGVACVGGSVTVNADGTITYSAVASNDLTWDNTNTTWGAETTWTTTDGTAVFSDGDALTFTDGANVTVSGTYLPISITIPDNASVSITLGSEAVVGVVSTAISLGSGANLTVTYPDTVDTEAFLGVVTFADSTSTLTLAGGISSLDSAVAPTYTGAGTLALSGITQTIGSAISGDIALALVDNASVTLSSANSYTGGTSIASGSTLTITNASALGTNGSVGAITGAGTLIASSVIPYVSGLTDSAWTGNFTFNGATFAGTTLANYGNSGSTITFAGTNSGYVSTTACPAKIAITGSLAITNGSSGTTVTFSGGLTGTGTFTAGNTGSVSNTIAFTGDASGFTGTVTNTSSAQCILFGSSAPNSTTAGTIQVASGKTVNVASGKTWSATNGVYVAGTIGGAGTIGSAVTFADGATIDCSSPLQVSGAVTSTTGETLNVVLPSGLSTNPGVSATIALFDTDSTGTCLATLTATTDLPTGATLSVTSTGLVYSIPISVPDSIVENEEAGITADDVATATEVLQALAAEVGVTEVTSITGTTNTNATSPTEITDTATLVGALTCFDGVAEVGTDGTATVTYNFGISAMEASTDGSTVTITVAVTNADTNSTATMVSGATVTLIADGDETNPVATAQADGTSTVTFSDVSASELNGKSITVKISSPASTNAVAE